MEAKLKTIAIENLKKLAEAEAEDGNDPIKLQLIQSTIEILKLSEANG
jgi:hypothetical protein